MAIAYRSKMEKGLLIIIASGRDESVQQVIEYGASVIDLALATGATRVLCDERDLECALGTVDTFQAAQAIAERAPKIIRVAIVCGPKFLALGKFWETVLVNRSLKVLVDTDMARARKWLAMDDFSWG